MIELKKLFNKNLIKSYSGEVTWVILGYLIVVLGNIFLVKILTENLDPIDYGRLALSFTLSILATQVAFSICASGIKRYYILSVEQGYAYAFSIASKQLFLTGVFVAIFIEIIILGVLFHFNKIQLLLPTFIAIIFQILLVASSLMNAVQNAQRNRKIVAVHEGMLILLRVIFSIIIFTVLNKSNLLFLLIGYVVAVGIVNTSQLVFIKSLFKKEKDTKVDVLKWKLKIWKYSKPAMYYNLFTWIQMSSDRWAIETFMSTAEVGLFSTVLQLGWAPINIMTTIGLNFVTPIFFKKSGNVKNKENNNKVNNATWAIIKVTWIVISIIFIITYFYHSNIYKYLVSEEYRSISFLLPWMILAGGFFSTSQVLILKIQSDLRPNQLVMPKIMIALLGLSFNFIGVYYFGLKGIVGGIVSSSALSFIWLSLLKKV